MKVAEFQRHIGELYLEKDRRRGTETTFLWLMEEVGELAEAVRRAPRGGAAGAEHREWRANLEEEFADVLAWTASLANLLDVDLERALREKYPPLCKRCGAKPCACVEAPRSVL